MEQTATISVVTATESDLDAVLEIERDGRPEGGQVDFVASAITGGRCLVARDGATVTGFAILDRSLFGQPFMSLLKVRPADRRRGIGTALVQEAITATEGDRLFSSTNASNTAMRMLLGRLGFVSSGFIENLDPGDPELIYLRWLGGAGPAAITAPVEAPD